MINFTHISIKSSQNSSVDLHVLIITAPLDTVPTCCKDVSVNSFFPRTPRLWNSLPIECFPLTYDLNGFKSRIKKAPINCRFFLKRFPEKTTYIIWSSFMVHLYKMVISPYTFFSFFELLIFWVVSRVIGQKRSKMTKNCFCHAPYLRNHRTLCLID